MSDSVEFATRFLASSILGGAAHAPHDGNRSGARCLEFEPTMNRWESVDPRGRAVQEQGE